MSGRRLLVVSELYYPEETSTGYFVTHIAQGLASHFGVTALCSQPTYSERHLKAPRSERHAGVEIRRVWSTRFGKDRLAGRLLNLLTFTASVAVFCLMHVRRGDRLLVLTNPPSLPPVVGIIARIKGARPYLLVHDVYPEVLIATGLISEKGLPARVLRWLVSRTYALYESVVVLGRDMAAVARVRLGQGGRVSIIPNWGDVEEIRPLERSENAFAQLHNPENRTVIQFSGNIGRTHDVETILDAARRVGEREDVLFQFIGSGGKVGMLDGTARGSARIQHLPRQPRENLRGMLTGADAVVIAFVDRMLGVSVPSRMYNVMAAGTPIIAMAHSESELAQVVAEEACGWVLSPGDAEGLAAIVEAITAPGGREEARRLGMNGRDAVMRRFSYPTVVKGFETLLGEG